MIRRHLGGAHAVRRSPQQQYRQCLGVCGAEGQGEHIILRCTASRREPSPTKLLNVAHRLAAQEHAR